MSAHFAESIRTAARAAVRDLVYVGIWLLALVGVCVFSLVFGVLVAKLETAWWPL